MFNSKSFTIVMAVTLLILAATATFQVLEMCEYKLFDTLFGLK